MLLGTKAPERSLGSGRGNKKVRGGKETASEQHPRKGVHVVEVGGGL